jgi:hypothetical protein
VHECGGVRAGLSHINEGTCGVVLQPQGNVRGGAMCVVNKVSAAWTGGGCKGWTSAWAAAGDKEGAEGRVWGTHRGFACGREEWSIGDVGERAYWSLWRGLAGGHGVKAQ